MSININVDTSITEPSNPRGNNDSRALSSPPEQRSQEGTAQQTTQTSQNQTEEQENHLLFSCQCDSAGSIGTLLSCLRRVLSKSSSITSSSAPSSNFTSTQATTSGYGGASKLQHATVYAGPNGLTFHCVQGLAKQSQCSVDLPKGLFREYFVGEEEVWMESDSDDDDDGDDEAAGSSTNRDRASQKTMRAKETIQGGEFAINLTTVLECFSVLSKNHKPKINHHGCGNHNNNSNIVGGEYASLNNVPLCMSYDRDSATFHLEFLDEGGGCLVTCEVPGVAVDENGDQSGLASAFRGNPLVGRAILYSEALSAAVGELQDVPGASVVEVKLSKAGIELGAVGPRSEVWVTVPYHSRQGTSGMYVGLECYLDNEEDANLVRKYPLSAFLTGMRGLEIGCETCISVNSRGMMAIQHQVSRDDHVSGVRPSFVDFIMTCIEDEIDDEKYANESVREDARHGMRDVTNDSSVQEEASVRAKSGTSKHSRRKRQPERATHGDESSQSADEEQDVEASFHDDEDTEQAAESNVTETNTRSTATSRILGELEVDNDMISSNIGGVNKRRMSALADIRRKRERQLMNKRAQSDESEDQSDTGASSKLCRKTRRSSASREESYDSEHSDHEQTHSSRRHKAYSDTPQDPSQSQSESDNSESEQEGSLDVTADISHIYSKSASMRTSRHGSRRSGDGKAADSESEEEEEPRMMYGDTKLEFTQDGYGSDDSM
ncbi:hypothetical protein ACHAXN_011355 [Cyclotella atomus]